MPSKKRWIDLALRRPRGSPSDHDAHAVVASRSAHEIATTRCRCGGRKSLPVRLRGGAARERRPRRGRSRRVRPADARRPAHVGDRSRCRRRGPASKRALSREHAGRQVAVAAVADDEDDRRVLDLLRDLQRDPAARRPPRCRRRCPPRAPGGGVISSASAWLTSTSSSTRARVVDLRQVGLAATCGCRGCASPRSAARR